MENFEEKLNEILVRNSVDLEDGLNYYADGGYNAFISYAEVVEKIKAWDDKKKKEFIEISNKLEREHGTIKSYLDLIANTLM